MREFYACALKREGVKKTCARAAAVGRGGEAPRASKRLESRAPITKIVVETFGL